MKRKRKGPKSKSVKKLKDKIEETQKFTTTECYSKGTLISAEYSNRVYKDWLATLEDGESVTPYPLRVETMCAFLKDMREDWGFSISTVEHVFSKALRRYELVHFGRDTFGDKDFENGIGRTLRALKKYILMN